ncbi:sciellin [Trichomycterus rosablanca]|uniref:sciellin n=1 Tax=Trichomycterus rosablanca TaxID=2290929 RepID=UPI002F359B6E
MSFNQTLQSTKSGVSSSQATGSTNKRRKGLLQDNSWIKRGAEEDEPVDDDPNYGRDVLGGLKPSTKIESIPAKPNQTSTVRTSTSTSSVTKRQFGGSQELLNKSSDTTTKSSVTSVSSTTPTSPTKPPVPAKKPGPTTPTNSFTARVFSGANSSDKLLSPVKKSVDDKSPVLNDPPKAVTSSTEKENFMPPSPTITSVRKTTVTNTTPEKTQTSITETKTETYAKGVELSNYNSIKPTATTRTTITSTSSYDKAPRLDDMDLMTPTLSQSVYTNPVRMIVDSSVKSTVTPRVSQMTFVNPTPVPSTTTRIVGKRDLCSFCAKSIVEGERVILDDLNIFSHTFCFKCESCYRSLGNLEAGDTLWVHKGRVTCESCFSKTRDHWYH